ncbi:MAG: hypothetical protein OXI84_03935 [bacterium]|nr:hypothetical protein [bacterium]
MIKMACWAVNMPLRHEVQRFVEVLSSSVHDRAEAFMRRVRSLTIEDYAFLQSLSLQPDGHALGDYVHWLFGSLLVYDLLEDNEQFTAAKSKINELVAEAQPPNHLFPSTQLAEMYSIAIAEQGLGEIQHYPRIGGSVVPEEGDNGLGGVGGGAAPDLRITPVSQLPCLRLGDLLVNSDTDRVFMVATPDCDLQFAVGSERVPDEAESVLLIPGRLRTLGDDARSRDSMVTEPYLHKGERCRIVWDRKKIVTVPIYEFLDWSASEGYSRPARIRLPYAVKIQQEFVSRLSRVGIPVVPPIQYSVPVEVFEGLDDTCKPLGRPMDLRVTVIRTGSGNYSFVVAPSGIKDLLDTLKKLIDKYTEVAASAGGRRYAQLTSKIGRLQRCLAEPERFALMLEERKELPKSGKAKELIGSTIGLHRGGVLGDRCRNRHVICLNMVDD